MRSRRLIWPALGLLLLTVFLHERNTRGVRQRSSTRAADRPPISDLASRQRTHSPASSAAPGFPHRLSNTRKPLSRLLGDPHAILLENAFLDTDEPLDLPIPAVLRASRAPGCYIVQAVKPLDSSFRAFLAAAGAHVSSYIPNNALLVQASEAVARRLRASPAVQAVIPYEPYYKLKSSLLSLLLDSAKPSSGTPATAGSLTLNSNDSPQVRVKVLLFSDSHHSVQTVLRAMSIPVFAEEPSPFGPVLEIVAGAAQLESLAALAGVQEMEAAHGRVPANDLSRVALAVAADSITTSNYLGLTGTNVLVNINDTGVDASQPDLAGRVLFDLPPSAMDFNGHGTHVAGIIVGNGSQSTTVNNAPGSRLPPAEFQFRGMAPGATLFSISTSLDQGSTNGDTYLQQTAAAAGAFVSNNSWNYAGDYDYDLAAASYDAAVRDALPGTSGPQPLLIVFAAGNSGNGNNDGTGGMAGTIESPATAKNVITVGAVEQFRFITNETWTCANGGTCQTNEPWLGVTDSSNQVAAFSSRGNVGIGVEGESGRVKPDVVAPGTFVLSCRSSQWDDVGYYSMTNTFLTPAPDANYSEVLSNLNQALGPYYRFESGSSLAAAEVSGTLALMDQFYRDRFGLTNSPALMKALLVNGARSLSGRYDLHPSTQTNWQGWGLVHLPTSAPALMTNIHSGPVLLFDQNPETALATGQAQTRLVSVSPSAQGQPLRVTLAWTDPPGNPVAGVKLVNNLDLLVTNLDTGDVFFGNDIPAGQDYNAPWDKQSAPNLDFVNNTENVYLQPPLGAHYSVTVVGTRVNVNAVTSNTNQIVQDYALVISSGDAQSADALTETDAPPALTVAPLVTPVTNGFSLSASDWGAVLEGQRAGANPAVFATNTVPVPGLANAVLTIGSVSQWHFYVVTNDTAYTNAAFLTFRAVTLATPFSGSLTNDSTNAAPAEADIDLYVSRDSGLTNLDPQVLAASDVSLSRGGTESIMYSNATPGVYYIGVKAETQEGAEYGFVADFSALPFAQDDGFGNESLRGFPAPAPIPGGSPLHPGHADLFCVEPNPVGVQRVIVTNVLTTPNLADLAGALTHNNATVVLDNHSNGGALAQQPFVFDDSAEGDIPGAQLTDGPGTLGAYGGCSGFGPWRLDMSDTNQPATNDGFGILLQSQPDLTAGVNATILPGACRRDFLYVPPEASNLTVSVALNSGQGPVSVEVCPIDTPSNICLSVLMAGAGTNVLITTDNTSHPPLNPGIYALTLCNFDTGPVSVFSQASLLLAPVAPPATLFSSTVAVPLPDDAVTSSTINVTNSGTLLSAAVGVHIDHPRVSDLVLHLVSPTGTRVLLAENRGGGTTNGMGGSMLTTNITPVAYSGGPEAVTNTFDTGQTSGSVLIDYNFYSLPDDMRVYYAGQLLFDSGLVSFTGETNLSYGPGSSTLLTIVMNEGGNSDTNTAWFYQLSCTELTPLYLTFTENTNLTLTPIKFAPSPLTNVNYLGTVMEPSNGIFDLPEQSLAVLDGQPARGNWTLEIADTRAGAVVPPPVLRGWQLGLLFRNTSPSPIALAPGVPSAVTLGAGQTQWFTVDVPEWASFASNTLLTASSPVTLWFSQAPPAPNAATGDYALLPQSSGGVGVLATNGVPALLPRTRYYLGIQNTNASAVTFSLQVDFDVNTVVSLLSGVPYPVFDSASGSGIDYYEYTVSTNAVRAQFEVNGPSTNLTLVARRGLPLPSFNSYDYLSDNPGTNDQLIVVYDYSTPVALAAGEWFLGVLNSTGLPVSYSVMATEFPVYGTNIVVTNQTLTSSDFCFSWTSVPGVHYYIEAKTSLSDTNWVPISPTLTASYTLTSFCVPLPSPYSYFRVREGLALVAPPLLISSINVAPTGVTLNWTAPTNSQFNVQWSATLNPPSWSTFTNLPVSSNGSFFFLDDGSESGGLDAVRYYRLLQAP